MWVVFFIRSTMQKIDPGNTGAVVTAIKNGANYIEFTRQVQASEKTVLGVLLAFHVGSVLLEWSPDGRSVTIRR